jgi:hypothetical protein
MKHAWVVLLTLMGTLAATGCSRARPALVHGAPRTPDPETAAAQPYPLGVVAALERTHALPHAHGRRGDLELVGTRGSSLVVATLPDLPGTLPLRGAIVDVENTLHGGPSGTTVEPLFWWRPALVGADGEIRPLVADVVRPSACDALGPQTAAQRAQRPQDGIESSGSVDGIAWSVLVCAQHFGAFRASVRTIALPAGVRLGEQWNAGSANVSINDASLAWEGERRTSFVGLSQDGVALVFSGLPFTVRRSLVHIATSTFPGQITSVVDGHGFERDIAIGRASVFEVLPESSETAQRQLTSTAKGPGFLIVGDAQEEEIGRIQLPAPPLRLPQHLGSSARLVDTSGFAMTPRIGLGQGDNRMPEPTTLPRGLVTIASVDESGVALPAQVIVRGILGTPTPATLHCESPGAFVARNSVYITSETTRIPLAKGSYEIVVSAGPAYSIHREELRIEAGTAIQIRAGLKRLIDTAQFTACDFHLHAAPSPDAPVDLAARVASLAAGGIELAVATDHNAIADYAPAVHALGLDTRLATVIGDEVTSQGKNKWGHFNAFPLGKSESYYTAVPPYFNLTPETLLAGARAFGAQLLQVNHARMDPQIGYFDLVHFRSSDGAADSSFSANFDILEVHNGLWLSRPDKVREGLRDAFGLLRLGKRTTVTGNSDSHKLFVEQAGYPRTYVEVPAYPRIGREARVIAALKRGATTVSAGPLVEVRVEGLGPGGVVKLPRRGTVRVWIRVSAPAWVPVDAVDVIVNDATVLHFGDIRRADGIRFERSVSIPIKQDSGLLVWASAQAPLPHVLDQPGAAALGFTGLVYIDADDDGKVQIPAASTTAAAPQVRSSPPEKKSTAPKAATATATGR